MLALGLIVGSDLNHWEILKSFDRVEIETPFGPASSPLWIGHFKGVRLVVLFRHGERADLMPSEVNYRANIYALKVSGVQKIIALESVSGLSKTLHSGQFVLSNESIDLTSNRSASFSSVSFSSLLEAGTHPLKHKTSSLSLVDSLSNFLLKAKAKVETKGVCLCIDDFMRSNSAEVRLFQSWNVTILGSSLATEDKLSREAQLEYVHVGMVAEHSELESSKPGTLQAHKRTLNKMTALFTKALEGVCGKLAAQDLKVLALGPGRAQKGLGRGKRNIYQFKSSRDSNRTRRKQASR
jgi:5'-methylthioadenosine phosphorylase